MSEDRRANFRQRYADGDMPWDSGITPPEIVEILDELPAGRAFDLGCGTGTVIRDLLRAGWQADGVDYVERAIELASAKMRPFPAGSYQLFCHDVTRLDALAKLRSPYDLIIDIGCGHGIDKARVADYARSIADMLRHGGTFMLYASHPRPESTVGWAPAQVEVWFRPRLELVWHRQGRDSAIGVASSWYRMRNP